MEIKKNKKDLEMRRPTELEIKKALGVDKIPKELSSEQRRKINKLYGELNRDFYRLHYVVGKKKKIKK